MSQVADAAAAQRRDIRSLVLFDKRQFGPDRQNDWITFPWEDPDATADNADIVTRLMQYLEIPNYAEQEGLKDTPARFLKAMKQMTIGYEVDVTSILERRFKEPYDQMVALKRVPFWSLCEHHLLPFSGHATVAYIPNGSILGLSKMARIVHAFSRRLQVQERLTQEIAHAINSALLPLGVGVLLEATHTCMAMRGVRSGGNMVTSCLLGEMKTDAQARAEFLDMARNG
jgi:GTP cyclohydrolase I